MSGGSGMGKLSCRETVSGYQEGELDCQEEGSRCREGQLGYREEEPGCREEALGCRDVENTRKKRPTEWNWQTTPREKLSSEQDLIFNTDVKRKLPQKSTLQREINRYERSANFSADWNAPP